MILNEELLKKIVREEIDKYRTIFDSDVNSYMRILINESFGISLEIENKANEIINYIKGNLKAIDGVKDKYGNIIKVGTLPYNFRNIFGAISFTVVNFITEERFDKFYDKYDFIGYAFNTADINLTIAMYNGKFLNDTFGSTIQHELSHILDNLYYDGHSVPDSEDNLYKQVKRILVTDENCEENLRKLALSLYISFKTEQIAHANGLDNMFKNGLKLSMVKETSEFNFLYILKDVIDNFDGNYADLCQNNFNKTPNYIKNRLTQTYKDYSRRLARVIMKWKEENLISEDLIKRKPLKI